MFRLLRLSEWFGRVYPRRTLAVGLAIAIIVWFAGPLGTFQSMPPLFRFIYWGGLIFGSMPFGYAVRMTVTRRWPGLSLWVAVPVMATLFSLAYTPVVFVATHPAEGVDLVGGVPLWMMVAGTFLAAACVYTVRALLTAQHGSAAPDPARDRPGEPRLLQRIEADLRGPLMSISVRDHYVDVRTATGKASLLMRLSDAIAETEGVEGAQVHRSHWVAWDAVQGVDRRGSNLVLRMADGAVIPVSRNHREKLEERGLI